MTGPFFFREVLRGGNKERQILAAVPIVEEQCGEGGEGGSPR